MYSLFLKYISKEIEKKATMIAFTDKFWRENKQKKLVEYCAHQMLHLVRNGHVEIAY